MWDARYQEPGYAYGDRANDFLVEHLDVLPKGKVLCLAEGEGRNAVFLARHGFDVTAVDSSSVGLKKAQALAKEHDVSIETVVTDLDHYSIVPDSFEAIVSIFCHLPPAIRKKLHEQIYAGLKPGGVFLLEAYTPEQLTLGTGGPPVEELMMDLESLKQEIKGLSLQHETQCKREIHEGKYHNGLGAVVQILAVKA